MLIATEMPHSVDMLPSVWVNTTFNVSEEGLKEACNGGKFGGNFAGFFSDPQIKAKNIRSIFREKILDSKKSLIPTAFCRRATLNLCVCVFNFKRPRAGTP